MLDLDNISVSEECAMMCTEVRYEDEDVVVYRDQGISTEEYEKATYGKLTKTQSEEEEEVKKNVALCANDSVSLEKKRRQLNETTPNKYAHGVSQSDISLNESPTGNTFNNVATVVQGPTGDDDKNESQKAWTMEMLMNDGNISTTMMNGSEQASEDYKRFLYARATYSNHAIQYHMQQIIERQKVVNEYRSMTMKGMSLIPLESNLYINDLVVISQTIQMIEVDNFWHLKTFEVVITELWRRWDEAIHEQKDMSMHCTENCEINDELDGKEVIDLCSKNQTTTSELHDSEEIAKQKSQDKMKSKTITRLESKNRPEKDNQAAETEENKTAMMCWENLGDSPGKEHYKETDDEEKPLEETQKPKDEEEHVNSTLHTGNQLKLSIEGFNWETENDRSMLDTQETAQQQLVYITNLEDDLQKNSTKLNEEEGPKDKKACRKNRLLERPSLVNLSHVSELYEESGSENKNIEENRKGENEKNVKELRYTIINRHKIGKQAKQQKNENPRNITKSQEMEGE